MSDRLEDRIRTIVARVLKIEPGDLRPETLLLVGDVGVGLHRLVTIGRLIENAYGVTLPTHAPLTWTSVADVILSAETAIAAMAEAVRRDLERERAA